MYVFARKEKYYLKTSTSMCGQHGVVSLREYKLNIHLSKFILDRH